MLKQASAISRRRTSSAGSRLRGEFAAMSCSLHHAKIVGAVGVVADVADGPPSTAWIEGSTCAAGDRSRREQMRQDGNRDRVRRSFDAARFPDRAPGRKRVARALGRPDAIL